MLAARFRVEGTVNPLHQPVNQEAGAFIAKACFTQIERFENTPPYDVPLYRIGMMMTAIYLHHPGEHGGVAIDFLICCCNHGISITSAARVDIDFGQY
jgi:hypothetical protein